jgi:hypothetical protein
VVCDFAAGHLVCVDSTLFPALPEEINELTWNEPSWLKSPDSLSWDRQKEVLRILTFDVPLFLSSERGDDFDGLADRWILPHQASRRYRPIWRVLGVDETDRRWTLLVDAETNEVLGVTPAFAGGGENADLYASAIAAHNKVVTNTRLEYGGGNSILTADRVHLTGPRVALPNNPAAPVVSRLLSATAFYHAYNMQNHFRSDILPAVGLSLPTANNSPLDDVTVELAATVGNAFYQPVNGQHTLVLHSGEGGPFPVHDPGNDGEVVGHEWVHAFLRYWNNTAFQFNPGGLEEAPTRALDEGMAFYYACVYAGDPQWGEFAYSDPAWASLRGLATARPAALASVNDPAGASHGQGMDWARCFWELRGTIGLSAQRVILRAFFGLGGPITNDRQFALAALSKSANLDQFWAVFRVMTKWGYLP